MCQQFELETLKIELTKFHCCFDYNITGSRAESRLHRQMAYAYRALFLAIVKGLVSLCCSIDKIVQHHNITGSDVLLQRSGCR